MAQPASGEADAGQAKWLGTPFAERAVAMNRNALWMHWGQMMVADSFDDMEQELAAIRGTVAVADMSPLAKYDVTGPDALAVVDRTITRDAHRLQVGQAYYTPWCDEHGKLVNDGLVVRVDEGTYRFSGDPNLAWLRQCADGYDVEVQDMTRSYGILTLQGPHSTQVLAGATEADWQDLPFSRMRRSRIAGCPVEVLRQGFTGEIGYEIWVAAADAVPVWDAVLAAGERFRIRPAGAWAVDVARVEAGLVIVGYDYTAAGPDSHGAAIQAAARFEASPFELGMGSFVDLRKPDFIGRDALARETAEGSRTRLVGLEVDWQQVVAAWARRGMPPPDLRRVRWYPIPVAGSDSELGRATSLTWSPTAKKLIGFGHLPPKYAEPGETVRLNWPADGGEEISATVTSLPFVTRRRSRALV